MARVIYKFVFAIIAALLSHGCASGGGETLKIDVRHVVGRK